MLECGEWVSHLLPYLPYAIRQLKLRDTSTTLPASFMCSQYESIHLGPFSYLVNPNDPQSLYWENVVQESGTARVCALHIDVYNFVAAIGNAVAFDPLGNTIAEISASADMDETPLLYASANTSSFNARCMMLMGMLLERLSRRLWMLIRGIFPRGVWSRVGRSRLLG